MPVSYPTKILVWAAAGGRCCICKKPLHQDDQGKIRDESIGEVAHIEGENRDSKRYNQKQNDDKRNGFENLMLLCPNDHTEIDTDEKKYPVPMLIGIKQSHEKWVYSTLQTATFNLVFAELEVALKYLTGTAAAPSQTTYKVIPPKDKILKNNLSDKVTDYITMGMIRSDLIGDYLNRNPDVNFSTRLRDRFIEKYEELKKAHDGDDLFFELLRFTSGGSNDFSIQAASLTVLVYFFQICDVFES